MLKIVNMSGLPTGPSIDTYFDLDHIQHLDFNVSCDYKDCLEVATHRLICPNCGQFEFMCSSHTVEAKKAPRGSYIIFDRSCKHRVDMFDCGKEPI